MEGRIFAKAFTPAAAAELEKIDFKKTFNLYGVKCTKGVIDFQDDELEHFDAAFVLRLISKALNGEGFAWATYKMEDDDGSIAYTYYDLGDGMKAAFFGCGYDIDFDIDYSECLYAALSLFSEDELLELYKELNAEVPDRGDKREELIHILTINEPLFWNDDTLTSGPYQRKMREAIIHNFENNTYESTSSFAPDLSWEEKGIARFSDKEKENLSKK